MNPKLLPGLALVLLVELSLNLSAFASRLEVQVLPGGSGAPVSVQVADGDFGERFTVFYQTNETTTDEFLHAQLELSDEGNRLGSCRVEKMWTTNGVQFEFTVAAAHIEASKFTISEQGHVLERPMPAFTNHWFYLRDFAAKKTPSATNAVRVENEPPSYV
jgi:hypothetical protein